MNLAQSILRATETTEPTSELLWGQVISVSPTLVRLAGDTVDTTIPLHLSSYTPSSTDKVLIARLGRTLIILGDIV